MRRAAPSILVLASVLATTLVFVAELEVHAYLKLGLPIRFGARQVRELLMPSPTEELNRTPQRNNYHKKPFTSEPILFVGDSQLERFCETEGVTTNPTCFFMPACTTAWALQVLSNLTPLATPPTVILNVGTGDVIWEADFGPTLIDNYRRILERLKRHRVIVLLPAPVNLPLLDSRFRGLFGSRNHGQENARLERARKLIREVCARYPNVRTIDITPWIVGADGQARPDFVFDGLHFKWTACDIWWAMIRRQLQH